MPFLYKHDESLLFICLQRNSIVFGQTQFFVQHISYVLHCMRQMVVILTCLLIHTPIFGLIKLYGLSLVLRPLKKWSDQVKCIPRLETEGNIVSPFTLRDVLFFALSPNFCCTQFGPITIHSKQTWQKI